MRKGREEGAVCTCFAQQQIKIHCLHPLPSICAKTDHNIKAVNDFFNYVFFIVKKIWIFNCFQLALILGSHEVVYTSILN